MKPAARLVALLGALGVGWLLFSAAPRDVVLVYDVGEPASALDVEIRRGGKLVRHAELSARRGGQIEHRVRLPDGAYELRWRLTGAGPSGARTGERPLEVEGDGTVVLPLGR